MDGWTFKLGKTSEARLCVAGEDYLQRNLRCHCMELCK